MMTTPQGSSQVVYTNTNTNIIASSIISINTNDDDDNVYDAQAGHKSCVLAPL
jgi:hypothetical protein